MPKHISRRRPICNETTDLPDLFSCRSAVLRHPPSHGAQFVMRRYRVAPHMAEVIAALAGLGGGEQH
jgi:hypothetical protein